MSEKRGFRIVEIGEDDIGKTAIFTDDAARGMRALADYILNIEKIVPTTPDGRTDHRDPDQMTLQSCAHLVNMWADRVEADGMLLKEGLVGTTRDSSNSEQEYPHGQ